MKIMGNLLKRVITSAMVCLIGVTSTGFTTIELPITSMSVSATDDYTTWKQGDSRWGSMRLGSSSYTMSNSGCAATALAKLMVMSGSVTDSSFNPGVLCTYFNQNGGFSSAGDISWSVSTKYSSSFTFEGYDNLSSSSNSGKAQEIQKLLDQGYYIILGVKDGGHWVPVDKVDGSNIYAYDPADGKYVSVFEKYSASGVYKLRLFKGANSKSTATTTSDSTSTTTETKKETVEELPNVTDNAKSEEIKSNVSNYSTGLYKLTCELCLRTDAFSDADVIDIIPVNEELNVSEVDGNWGYVCYNGNMGWINLQYTKKSQSSYKYSTGVYTTAEPLNYRASNSTSAESYGIIPTDTEIRITQVKDNWGKTIYNGQVAWVCLNYVSEGYTEFSSATNIAVTNSSEYELGVYRAQEELNLREDPSASNTRIGVVRSGSTFNIISISDGWGKVVYEGKIGWICLDYADYVDDYDDYIPYDMNGDGVVNVADVFYISSKLKSGESFTSKEINLVDFDDDGKVSYDDYTTFKNLLMG
jgi:uncharacterized protein YgiM (DUF1202 family)